MTVGKLPDQIFTARLRDNEKPEFSNTSTLKSTFEKPVCKSIKTIKKKSGLLPVVL